MDLSDLKKLGLDVAYPFKEQYENYIGGQWVAPAGGEYFDNLSPITGQPFCRVPRSGAADVELALDAAHRACAAS
ncbi:aldehyde dehydrogenase, partial [Bordetella pertussis]